MAYRVGIDIGGTFTDLVVIDEQGRVNVDKVPSTPPNFAQGVIDGLDKISLPIEDSSPLRLDDRGNQRYS